MSRDPYHNARQRFKVARDRFLKPYWPLLRKWRFRERYNQVLEHYTVEQVVDLVSNPPSQTTWLPLGPITYALNPVDSTEYRKLLEAAGILTTMLKTGITDEQNALMYWKLSRD